MQNGRLITPANGNAKDALQDARKLDPTDPNVVQAIREFTGMLADEARKSLAANKTEEAQTFVNAARGLGSANPALAAVERQLTELTRAAAAAQNAARRPAANPAGSNDPMIGEIRQRMTEGKLIDPPGDSARDLLVKFGSASPNNPALEDLSRQFTTRMLDMSRQATQAKAFSRAEQLLAAAREIGGRYSDAAISQAEKDFTSARDANLAATNIVSAASLTRTRTVNPNYPESARKRGIEGWVELAFTVTPKGTVEDVEVRNASPADVFDDAAVRAVRGWRFEPVVRNGETVSQRAMVRLRFSQTGQ
jgi:TonB family protein